MLAGMSPTPRSATPITSAAQLSVWWAEVLAETETETETAIGAWRLSLMWLDSHGRMLARVLSLAGVASRPSQKALAAIVQIHGAFVEDVDETDGHLALALSRPGESSIGVDDQAWAAALQGAMRDRPSGT